MGKLASELGYSIAGPKNTKITGIAFANEAQPGDLAIAYSKQEAEKTTANVVLTRPHFLPTNKTYLFSSDEMDLAMLRAVKILIAHGLFPDYSAVPVVMPYDGYFVGEHVQIGEGVSIGPCAVICSGAVLGSQCVIGANTYIGSGVSLGDRVRVAPGARLGIDSFYHIRANDVFAPFVGIGKVLIGHDVSIGSNTTVQRGTISDTIVGPHTQIGNLVEIGHDVKIGMNCKIVSQSGIAGNAVIDDHVTIYGQCGIANKVHVGSYAVIKAKSLVTKHVKPNHTILGPFGRESRQELRLQAKLNHIIKGKE